MTKCGAEVPDVGVEPADDVAARTRTATSTARCPCPMPGGSSGRISATARTRAPSQRGDLGGGVGGPVVDRRRPRRRAATCSTRLRRTVATIWPTVASSLRAGRQTETERSAARLASARASASGSSAPRMRCRVGRPIGHPRGHRAWSTSGSAAQPGGGPCYRLRRTRSSRAAEGQALRHRGNQHHTRPWGRADARCQCLNDEQSESGPPLEALESASRTAPVPAGRTEETPMAHVHALRCRECGREYEVAPDLHL